MRTSNVQRQTAETDISLTLDLDGKGRSEIDTGVGFLDHMLTLFSKHSRFDLKVKCRGDVQVDFHHTAEDIGIALGQAFLEAIGDKKGITRYADTILPMDETLILSAVDISGRAYLSYDAECPTAKVGDFDTELSEEFWQGFVREAKITLHIKKLDGRNSHHIIEGIFKSVARTLRAATRIDPDLEGEVPSTKGVI
ncbi:MAG: imidazoleglycerol-phosphate dehydratase HisB [Clostridia bacterium]|nr:imidazoleglycerol-phosphate dehydratase HisB [Clostridia bacterium]